MAASLASFFHSFGLQPQVLCHFVHKIPDPAPACAAATAPRSPTPELRDKVLSMLIGEDIIGHFPLYILHTVIDLQSSLRDGLACESLLRVLVLAQSTSLCPAAPRPAPFRLQG